MRLRESNESSTHASPKLSRLADVAAILVVLVLSIPSLIWFGKSWAITFDATEYLLSGWHLVTGEGYTLTNDIPFTKRGPVLPALIGFLTFPFGRDTETLAWAVRLLATVNPLLGTFWSSASPARSRGYLPPPCWPCSATSRSTPTRST